MLNKEHNVERSKHLPKNEMKLDTAIFGAGCFWGVEQTFRLLKGVIETEVGYSGGHVANPTYELVCTHTTGHAEVVKVTFDPKQISYKTLVEIFFKCHDPTQINRQGPDVGDQYRSVIFYNSEEQKETALKIKEELEKSGKYSRPIATQISEIMPFYKAEEYHQQFAEKNPQRPCHVYIDWQYSRI